MKGSTRSKQWIEFQTARIQQGLAFADRQIAYAKIDLQDSRYLLGAARLLRAAVGFVTVNLDVLIDECVHEHIRKHFPDALVGENAREYFESGSEVLQ